MVFLRLASHVASIVALTICLGAFALAQSQPPPPTPSVGAQSPQQKPAAKDANPDSGNAPVAASTGQPQTQNPDQGGAKQNQQPPADRGNWFTNWFTNNGANWAIVLLTFVLAVIACFQYKAANTTNTHNTVIERAYMDLSHIGGLQLGQTHAAVSLKIKNNGKTPGDVLGGRINLSINNLPQGMYGWVPLSPGPQLPPAFINPGDELSFGPIQLPLGTTPITPQVAVIVIGTIDYRDRFGGLHRSGYARQLITPAPSSGNNLVFSVATAGLNYDRPLTKEEQKQYSN